MNSPLDRIGEFYARYLEGSPLARGEQENLCAALGIILHGVGRGMTDADLVSRLEPLRKELEVETVLAQPYDRFVADHQHEVPRSLYRYFRGVATRLQRPVVTVRDVVVYPTSSASNIAGVGSKTIEDVRTYLHDRYGITLGQSRRVEGSQSHQDWLM
ncbi:MAG: hypothetical protein ACOCWQ_04220 [Nanoarchaeota archaeon]